MRQVSGCSVSRPPPPPLVPDIVTAWSRGMIFFWTSSRGPGLRASFSFRSSASRARFSLSWASREEPGSEAGSAQHTAAPHRQQGNTAALQQHHQISRAVCSVVEICVDVWSSAKCDNWVLLISSSVRSRWFSPMTLVIVKTVKSANFKIHNRLNLVFYFESHFFRSITIPHFKGPISYPFWDLYFSFLSLT